MDNAIYLTCKSCQNATMEMGIKDRKLVAVCSSCGEPVLITDDLSKLFDAIDSDKIETKPESNIILP